MERATASRHSGRSEPFPQPFDVEQAVGDPAASDLRLYVGTLVLLAALLLRLFG